jgi:hypothetical protein
VVMVFPNIEKIKQDYTDKYVMVDPQRPELARFANAVGQVKTVNMSGRALVEFLDYHLNIGWYDIELEFLKVVDKPLPKEKTEKPVPKKPQDKPEGKAAPTTGDKQIADAKKAPAGATSKEGAGAKPSTADILAKLKGGAGAAPAAAPAAKKEAAPKATAPAAAGSSSAGASPEKVDRAKMSVADMIAAAKGGAASAAKAEPAAPAQEAPAPGPSIPEPVPVPAVAAKAPPAEVGSLGGVVKIDRSGMSVDVMVAYCREKDAG